jgi:sugar O-acyltransferase (sialic acid O-acetyltransferase NeuD family)
MIDKIGLLGSGGQADEAESFFDGEVAFRAVSKEYLDDIATVDIREPSDDERRSPVCAAVGAPALKVKLLEEWPGTSYQSIISERAYVDDSAEVGEGSIIAPNAVITTNVKIGRHVIINVAASLQHNTEVGDFVSIGPGAHVAGNVVIGDGVYVGIGAVISNGVKISDGAVIGAGATLLKDADTENGVYVGVPARLIKTNEGWLREI